MAKFSGYRLAIGVDRLALGWRGCAQTRKVQRKKRRASLAPKVPPAVMRCMRGKTYHMDGFRGNLARDVAGVGGLLREARRPEDGREEDREGEQLPP